MTKEQPTVVTAEKAALAKMTAALQERCDLLRELERCGPLEDGYMNTCPGCGRQVSHIGGGHEPSCSLSRLMRMPEGMEVKHNGA